MLACGVREAMVMAPPPTRDSALSPCFHGCLAFLHSHFPPQSPPSHPLDLSLCSQPQPSPRDCSTIPKLQLPATAHSSGAAFLSGAPTAAARTVWCSFHLGCHRSAVSRSASNVSPLTQTVAPMWGSDPASVPPPAEGRSSPTNAPVFPLVPSSYRVLGGSMYSFPLVRYSRALSVDVLHALLYLKVYSWPIRGERTILCPLPPPSSCFLPTISWIKMLLPEKIH